MKKLFLISFSVFLLILSLTLISCGNDGGGSASKDSGITEGTKWENVDFTGDKIRISISVDQYDNKATTPASERYVRGSDSAGSDEILNMVFDRNKKVRDMLGLDVEYMEVHHQFRDVQPYINEIVMSYNEGTSPDLFINDCFGTVRAAMDGSLYNVMEGYGDTSESFFDFQDEHGWYSEYMNGLTLNPAVKYVVAGDYFIDVLRAAHTLYINIDLFESYVGDIEANLYAEIKQGNWFYDDLSELATMGWEADSTNKTPRAQPDDICVGLAADTLASYTFFYTSSVSMYTKEPDGSYSLPYDNQDYFAFANEIINLMNEQSVCLTNEVGATADKRTSTMFANQNVMMAEGMWISDLETPEIRAMTDRIGVTVYPKRNSGVKNYTTFVHDIAEIGSIPISTTNFRQVSAFLQCVTEESSQMVKQYTEYAVKFKYNKDFATADMIDIIYKSIGSPFEGVMTRLAFEQVVPFGTPSEMVNMRDKLNSCIFTGNNTFTNNYQASYNAYNEGIKALVNRFNQAAQK